jgi:SET and MYND domain-containing protein 4
MENKDSSKPKLIDKLFAKLCNKLKSHDKELNEKFNRLTTNFDRFKFVYSIGFAHRDIDAAFEKESFDSKCVSKALEYRKQGNEHFKSKEFEQALAKYNLSLRYAPVCVSSKNAPLLLTKQTKPESKEIEEEENLVALAYANRSAVFFHINEFSLCINDINSSLNSGYPAKLKNKLIERKLNCLIRQCDFNAAERLLEEETHLFDAEGSKMLKTRVDKERERYLNSKQPLESTDTKYEPINDSNDLNSYEPMKFELGKRQSANVSSASESISIDYTIESGMHIRSTKKIDVGELLVDELPYASVLIATADNVSAYCFECMRELCSYRMNVTYCLTCSFVSYCSLECRQASWRKAHAYECRHTKTLACESGLTHMEWLAMRVVLNAKLDYLLSLEEELREHEARYEILRREDEACVRRRLADCACYKSNAYMNVFYLMTNSCLRKSADLFRRSFVALFMAKFLVRSGYFKELNTSSSNKSEQEQKQAQERAALFVGGLILRHMQSIACNAHEIGHLRLESAAKNAMANASAKGIGAGIYALLSIFNHSCNPHVTRTFFDGTRCQIRAMTIIGNGEQVYDNYGVVYAINEKHERQHKLVEQYFFDCGCLACVKDWPLYENIPNQLSVHICKCVSCRKTPAKNKSNRNEDPCIQCEMLLDEVKMHQYAAQQSLTEMLRINSDINLRSEPIRRKVAKFYESFCTYLEILNKCEICKPFQEYNNYEEALKQCLNIVRI